MDAAMQAGPYLDRELQQTLPKVYDKTYAEIPYSRMVPVSTVVDPGAVTFKYDVWDRVGEFDLISDFADDLPTSDVKRGEVINDVRPFAGSFTYTEDEILHAQFAKKPIDTKKQEAVRESYERRANTTCLFGRAGTNLKGFFNHPAVDTIAVTGNNSDAWFDDPNITPQQMLDLLNFGVTAMVNSTQQVERPNALAMPYSDWRKASTTCRSSTDNTTVMELFQKQNPYITSIDAINELDPANSNGNLSAKRMVFYTKSPEKMEFHITLPLTFLPRQSRNLAHKIPAWAKFGGFTPYFPKSILYLVKGA
jgi:hypothetical protein